MKKMLIVPHHPDFRSIKIRLAELARWLSADYEVYYLDWHSASGKNSLAGRIGACLKDLLRPTRIELEGHFKVLEIPMLHRPLGAVHKFNSFWLNKIINELKIDIVVNGSYYLFSLPAKAARDFKYIVDLADVPTSGMLIAFDAFIDRAVRREIIKADIVTVSSQGLAEYVKSEYNVAARFLPNGADLNKFYNVSAQDILDIRRKFGLVDKWVIGHIGYIGDWVDINFLVDVFKDIKKVLPNAALFLVGSSPRLDEYRRLYADEDIIFAGQVDPRAIEPYFLACDVGVLPNKKSNFQDLAFHIKLIEFAAAKKLVISSDLDEVKTMALPNVRMAPFLKSTWVSALLEMKNVSWQRQWEASIEIFDWKKISSTFKEMINE